MKYSNYTGIITAFLLITVCFIPWVYIETVNVVVSGVSAPHTNFGRPGALHIFFAITAIFLFAVQKVWAKRLNLIVGTLNFAWSIRNFLIITQCEMGDCPQKKPGIYAIVIFSFLMFVMTLLPKLEVKS